MSILKVKPLKVLFIPFDLTGEKDHIKCASSIYKLEGKLNTPDLIFLYLQNQYFYHTCTTAPNLLEDFSSLYEDGGLNELWVNENKELLNKEESYVQDSFTDTTFDLSRLLKCNVEVKNDLLILIEQNEEPVHTDLHEFCKVVLKELGDILTISTIKQLNLFKEYTGNLKEFLTLS